jgi:Rrf2 family protein
MDVIRRNTDYAIRLVAGLVDNYGKGPMSAKTLAEAADISFEMACKLLKKLASVKLVKSTMGKAGGFELAKEPAKVRFYDIIAAIQGNLCLNRCVADPKSCPKSPKCPVSKKLAGLQNYIEQYLKDITLDKLLK